MFLLKLFIFSLLALQTCLSQTEESDVDDVDDAVTTGYSATDCLSYIYVAWIIFIYSVGLGVETAQFSQVIVTLSVYVNSIEGREMIFSLSSIENWRRKSTFCCGYSLLELNPFLLFQVVTNIYTFIPQDCGGYYTGQAGEQ